MTAFLPQRCAATKLRSRRGVTMLEVAVSVIVLGALLAMSVQALQWTGRERRAADRRAAALIEAGNVLDRCSLRPWDELTAEMLKMETLSPEAAAILPGAELHLTVNESEGPPRAKRIVVAIEFPSDGALRSAPVKLTTWVHPLP